MARRLLAIGAAWLGLLAFAGTAAATTLGITGPPTSASAGGCDSAGVYGQVSSDPSTPFIGPAGGGQITQWQTYTAHDTAGSSITLVVLTPTSAGNYSVDATDTETVPNPLPSSGLASFTLAHPIQIAAGETLGLYSAAANACFFYGGGLPSDDELFGAAVTAAPSAGAALTTQVTVPGYVVNVAVTLVTTQDAGVESSVPGPSSSVGADALLTSVVANNGPATGQITFTDQVPSGLQIVSAVADSGTCGVSGQTVICAIPALAVGTTAAVDVVVTASKAGTYTNSVSVATGAGLTDPNSANNTASAALVVAALPQQCVVPGLKKLPLATARTVLSELGCAVRVKTEHSSLTKGLVIKLSEATGTYPYRQSVTVTVSSGRKPKKRKRR